VLVIDDGANDSDTIRGSCGVCCSNDGSCGYNDDDISDNNIGCDGCYNRDT